MWLTVERSDLTEDVAVTDHTRSTVGQLAAACGLRSDRVHIDGVLYRAETPVRDVALAPGSVLGERAHSQTEQGLAGDPGAVVAELRHIAGWGASDSVALAAGDFGVAARSGTGIRVGPTQEPHLYVRVTADGSRCKPGEGRYVNVDGRPAYDVPNARDRVIVASGSAFVVDQRGSRHLTTGPMLWNRPPRVAAGQRNVKIEIPQRPASAQTRQALSWAMLLAPIPIGLIMAWLWSWIFALFIIMSPIMMLGQWFESRNSEKKDRRRYGREYAESMAAVRDQVRQVVRTEQIRARAASPDIAELRQWPRTADPRLWERRPGHDDHMHLVAGYADEPLELEAAGAGASEFDDALRELEGHQIADAPVIVDWPTAGSVGIAGPRHLALGLARSLLLQAATLHGPSDTELAVFTADHHLDEWDWLKWLPHLRSTGGAARIATALDEVDELLPAPPSSDRVPFADDKPTGPARIAVVDNPMLLNATGSSLRAALVNDQNTTFGLVLAERADQIPSFCGFVLRIGTDGHVTVELPREGRTIAPVLPAAIAPDAAAEWSRSLARFHDPESAGASAAIPGGLTLLDLVDPLDPRRIADEWSGLSLDPTPVGVIGMSDVGPLVVDLATDGPHGLAAGTTGSGKSELLRTMVASMALAVDPDHLNFVLIDFKGGGAFDVCADLPHVVSVVTDLDEHLAERALRCLKAELRLREELLREHGATDLGEYLGGGGDRLPRLVVIIDEFATLAVELPDFLDSLVDIAQRGRSLGVHMILATQRPSGVLDNKVRANTNLRIALRVQDDGDSEDVIGTVQAARLSRNQPGRAFARFGQSEITEFQTALVTGEHVPDGERSIKVRPFSLVAASPPADDGTGAAAPTSVGGGATTEPHTDIELIVDAVRGAFELGGYTPPRVPWPDPLPDEIDAAELAEQGLEDDHPYAVAIGMVDLPDRQQQVPIAWSPDVGNSILYGVHAGDVAASMTTVALGQARNHSPEHFHLYGLEYSAGLLRPLAELPHCGEIVDGTDLEPTLRLIGSLSDEIADRRERFAAGNRSAPLVLWLIDNYAGLTELLDEASEFDAASHAGQIVRDGPAVGVFALIGAQSDRGVPMRLSNLVEHKMLFRLVDANAYTAFGLRPRDVPTLGPGRWIDPATGEIAQAARYDQGDVAATVAAIAAASPVVAREALPRGIEVLRTDYAFEDLDQTVGRLDDDAWILPIGVDAATLATTALRLATTEHALVVGGSGSGKSSALVTMAASARAHDPDLPIVAVAHRRSPLRASADITSLVGHKTSAARLRELIEVDRVLVLADDADTIPEAHAKVLADVGAGHADHRHIVAACRPDFPKGFDSWVVPLRRNQTGLALQPNPQDGDALRTMLPLHRPERFPVGRGFVITNSVPDQVQLCHPPVVPTGDDQAPTIVEEGAMVRDEPASALFADDTSPAISDDAKSGSSHAHGLDQPLATEGARISLGLDTFSTDPQPTETDTDIATVPARISLGLDTFSTEPDLMASEVSLDTTAFGDGGTVDDAVQPARVDLGLATFTTQPEPHATTGGARIDLGLGSFSTGPDPDEPAVSERIDLGLASFTTAVASPDSLESD